MEHAKSTQNYLQTSNCKFGHLMMLFASMYIVAISGVWQDCKQNWLFLDRFDLVTFVKIFHSKDNRIIVTVFHRPLGPFPGPCSGAMLQYSVSPAWDPGGNLLGGTLDPRDGGTIYHHVEYTSSFLAPNVFCFKQMCFIEVQTQSLRHLLTTSLPFSSSLTPIENAGETCITFQHCMRVTFFLQWHVTQPCPRNTQKHRRSASMEMLKVWGTFMSSVWDCQHRSLRSIWFRMSAVPSHNQWRSEVGTCGVSVCEIGS